jgi:hypothetical protein
VHATCPAILSSLIYHPNNIWWWMQIKEFLIVQFSPLSCNFIALLLKYRVSNYYSSGKENLVQKNHCDLLLQKKAMCVFLYTRHNSHAWATWIQEAVQHKTQGCLPLLFSKRMEPLLIGCERYTTSWIHYLVVTGMSGYVQYHDHPVTLTSLQMTSSSESC